MYLSESTFGSGIKEFPQIMLQEKCTQSEKKKQTTKYTRNTFKRHITDQKSYIISFIKNPERDTLKSRVRYRIGKN